jgi:hypothetical protein
MARRYPSQVFVFRSDNDARSFEKHHRPAFMAFRRGRLYKIVYSTRMHGYVRAMNLNLHDAVNLYGARVMTGDHAARRDVESIGHHGYSHPHETHAQRLRRLAARRRAYRRTTQHPGEQGPGYDQRRRRKRRARRSRR